MVTHIVIDASANAEAYALPRSALSRLYYETCAASVASRSPPRSEFVVVVDSRGRTPPSSPLSARGRDVERVDLSDSCVDIFTNTLQRLLPLCRVHMVTASPESENAVHIPFGVLALTQIASRNHDISEMALAECGDTLGVDVNGGSDLSLDVTREYENVIRCILRRFGVYGLDVGYVVNLTSSIKQSNRSTRGASSLDSVKATVSSCDAGVFLHVGSASGLPALENVANARTRVTLKDMYKAHVRFTSDVVLITGALGFIGSHVADAVVARMPHSRVVILDKHTYAANVRNIHDIAGLERVRVECADLSDSRSVHEIVQRHKPGLVIHLAAESHVDRSFGNSLNFTQSNVMGTHVLLEALREVGTLKYFVHMSTDEVYGAGHGLEDTNGHHPDTSLLMPTNPYAASKAAAEMQCNAYRTSFGMPVVIVRCNNVYGPRQFPEKAVPRFTLQLANNQKCTIHGEGRSLRSFLHVTDAARAVVAAVGLNVDQQQQRVINVHSDEEFSVIELARRIRAAVGDRTHLGREKDEEFVRIVPDRAFNDLRYLVEDNALGGAGWSPLVPFTSGLTSTVQWYLDNASRWFLQDDLSAAVYGTGHGERTPGDTTSQTSSAAPCRASKVLIFGKNGWIGPQFARLLSSGKHAFGSVEFATSRFEDTEAMWREISSSGATHVVNAAGITGRPNIDWCETHVSETVHVNLEGAVTLARICQRLNVHLTNFATGCIYTYDDVFKEPRGGDSTTGDEGISVRDSRPFTEDDPPNFFGSTYSRVKAIAESVQKTMSSNVLVLRLRMPLNCDLDHPRNLVNKLLLYETVITTRNSVSCLEDLLPIAAHMLATKRTGIYNFTNGGHVSPSDVLTLYKESVDKTHQWREVTAEELMQSGTVLAPRSNCHLSNAKLTRYCRTNAISEPMLARVAVSQCITRYARERAGHASTPAGCGDGGRGDE